MTKPKVLSEQPISVPEVQDIIKEIKKRDEELNFRSNRTEEYLNVFSKVSAKDAVEIKSAIEKLKIPRLGEEHIVKIIDILPKTVDELKVVIQGYPLTVTKENMQKIVDVVAKFA